MTKEFRVADATCGHCKATIEAAVTGVSGVRTAEFDLASKQLTVAFEQEVSSESVATAITAAGYTPEAIS